MSRNRPTTLTFICIAAFSTSATADTRAITAYVGRITSVPAWHDIITDPSNVEFVDAYLAVAALSQELRRFHEGRWSLEGEAQAAYNFGDQSHWEFNVAMGPRWHAFPWNDRVATTAAFGIGLSYATEVPEVEIALEEESERTLIYWVAEFTLGPPQASWAASLRLHHRSPAFGLLGDKGGMNALALGVRYNF